MIKVLKIENPSGYELSEMDAGGKVTTVYCGGFGSLSPASLEWRNGEIDEFGEYEHVLTLSEIAKQLRNDTMIITVFVQTPLWGDILQYGNYGDEWWKIGETCGYA